MKIYVARHGQDKDNAKGILNGWRDRPLTQIGIDQAYNLARGIEALGIKFDEVYTTPLCRGKRTAEITTERLGLPRPIVLPLLIERNFGAMTGKPTKDIERLCAPNILKTDTVTYFLNPSGAETFPDLFDRAGQALEYLANEHENSESLLLFSHGDLGKMLYASYYNIPWQEVLTGFHFGNCELLLLSGDANPNESHIIKVEQHNH